MKKLATIVTTVCFVLNLQAQELTNNLTPKNQRIGFYMGYYGNKITEPGIQIGVEDYLATTPNYQVVGSLFSTFFSKEKQYYAFTISPRIGLRYTASWGLSLESHFGFGYIFRHFAYDQYELNGDGNIVDKGNAGISSMMPNLALGLGYDFSRKANLPLKLYVRPSCSINYPEGHILFQASYALEAGIIYIPTLNHNKSKK